LVRTADELGPVVLLAGEFEEWVRARVLAEYGIDFEFKASAISSRPRWLAGAARAALHRRDQRWAGWNRRFEAPRRPQSWDQADVCALASVPAAAKLSAQDEATIRCDHSKPLLANGFLDVFDSTT